MFSRKELMFLMPFSLILVIVTTTTVAYGSVVPYQERWGIYELDPDTGEIELIFSCPDRIVGLRLNRAGERFVFSQRIGGDEMEDEEICTLSVDGSNHVRLTDNDLLDTYPSWSPDGSKIAFLTLRGQTLDIYLMDSDGENEELLYDSGSHDADIHWVGSRIAFTRNSQIWVMNDDGSEAVRVTDPPRAGEWRDAVLPFGDYDPRISPDGSLVVFERMVDDRSRHGNYDLYRVDIDGSGEAPLTDSGWTQGLASWSHKGDKLVYIVSAMGTEGRYDIHTMNADGSDNKDLTSEIFPQGFLAHCAIFSADDSKVYFVGEWWDWKILETTISCSLSASEVIQGGSLTISGSIEPPVPGACVTLKFEEPDGSVNTRMVTTGPEGAYRETLKPSETGSWAVEASWEGDLGHHASASQTHEFTVLKQEQAAQTVKGGESTGGIPGFPLESLIIGLAISASMLFVSRRGRKTSILV